MTDLVRLLFSTEGFPPRWHCGDWTDLHGWVHVCSDTAIFGAYAAIPAALVYFALKRKDIPFLPIFWLFGAFILACGTGHLIEATIFWHPWYRLAGSMKVVTAIVSWGTVAALIRVLPRALELPGLARMNAELRHEIEERHKVEAALRRLERFEAAVLGASLDAIISIDHRGHVVGWNAAAERIFGYSFDAALGQPLATLVIPERLRSAHHETLAHYAKTGKGDAMEKLVEMPAVRADGREIIVELFITETESDTEPIFTGFARDITDQKRVEAEREAALARVQLVVEATPSAILMVDASGSITLVNSHAEELFGYTREELLGQSVDVLVPERYRAAHPGHRAHFFAAPSARAMGAGRDLFGRRKDGSEMPIEIGLNPVQTAEGSFVLASIIDITERKTIEGQRAAALERSEMLLREVHHRVKNNMQVVSSLLRLHAGKLRDPEQRQVFSDCRDRILAMSLIHQRLYTAGQFAQIEFGGYLGDMLRMILRSNVGVGRQVHLDLQFDQVAVDLDSAVPLSLIANELVLNALKHAFPTDRDGTLTVRLRKGDTEHELSVQDDGPGLPPDHTSGTGIGLELVSNLTRQIRGTANTTSGPGGLITTIRWPAESN